MMGNTEFGVLPVWVNFSNFPICFREVSKKINTTNE